MTAFVKFLDSLLIKNDSIDSMKERLRSHIKTLGIDAAYDITIAKLCMHFDVNGNPNLGM